MPDEIKCYKCRNRFVDMEHDYCTALRLTIKNETDMKAYQQKCGPLFKPKTEVEINI